MNMSGINDVYGGQLEATGSALIEAHERGHDLSDWGPTIRSGCASPGVGCVAGWCGSFARPARRPGALAEMP